MEINHLQLLARRPGSHPGLLLNLVNKVTTTAGGGGGGMRRLKDFYTTPRPSH